MILIVRKKNLNYGADLRGAWPRDINHFIPFLRSLITHLSEQKGPNLSNVYGTNFLGEIKIVEFWEIFMNFRILGAKKWKKI